jgi:hypothetical protein
MRDLRNGTGRMHFMTELLSFIFLLFIALLNNPVLISRDFSGRDSSSRKSGLNTYPTSIFSRGFVFKVSFQEAFILFKGDINQGVDRTFNKSILQF